MNIIEALRACQSGAFVRPCCWRAVNPERWVQAITTPSRAEPCFFAEHGTMEEIPHALRLSLPSEFFGAWEVVTLDADRWIVEQHPTSAARAATEGMTMTTCPECHHRPSGRFDAAGGECYCKCHDVADAAPYLLAALKAVLPYANTSGIESTEDYSKFYKALDAARTAVARAEAVS